MVDMVLGNKIDTAEYKTESLPLCDLISSGTREINFWTDK